MKLIFKARFRRKDTTHIYDEERLSDLFLAFSPTKIAIKRFEPKSAYASILFEIRMVSELFTMEEIKAKLFQLGVRMDKVCDISKEFTKTELKEVKAKFCYKEIFKPPEGKKK